ncbi:hypothetical protein NSU08_35740 [Paenibacillus sp. FSL H7-0331]
MTVTSQVKRPLQQQNAQLEQQNTALSAKLKWYEEQFRLTQ